MQYSQEHLQTMVYAEFGGQTECIMGNWKIENRPFPSSKNPDFQNEAKCTTFLVKMSFICMRSISKAEHLTSF